MIRRPPRATLFPSTTLFRSCAARSTPAATGRLGHDRALRDPSLTREGDRRPLTSSPLHGLASSSTAAPLRWTDGDEFGTATESYRRPGFIALGEPAGGRPGGPTPGRRCTPHRTQPPTTPRAAAPLTAACHSAVPAVGRCCSAATCPSVPDPLTHGRDLAQPGPTRPRPARSSRRNTTMTTIDRTRSTGNNALVQTSRDLVLL